MTTDVARVLAIIVVATAAAAARGAQDPAARGSIPVFATVTDRNGAGVVDLRPEDVTLRADGKPVPVDSFSRDDNPLSMLVILDTSASLAPKFDGMRIIAAGFLSQLRPGDRARVGGLSDTIQFSNATADTADLAASMATIKRGNPTKLYDALVASADVLRTESGRRVVLVLSDGEDTSSKASFRNAVDALHAYHVTAYSVGIEANFFNGIREVRVRPHRDLQRFADETGGAYFEFTPTIDLDATILRSMGEMRGPYVLTFTPPVLDGKNHKLEVLSARAGLTVRARKGYFARP